MPTQETISHQTLKELAQAGVALEARAVADGPAWSVVVCQAGRERVLTARNSRRARTWSNLNSVAKYLQGVGIRQFTADASRFDPDRRKSSRPDRAEALRQAHEAAEYDRWFREQVQQALEDPRPAISHEEMKARMEAWLTERYGPRPDPVRQEN